MTNMSFSFRYRLFASVFVLYSSLCGALDRARPTPNFARLSPALFTTFQVPGAVGTYPVSINDSETITGYYTEPAGTQGGFVRSADGAVETFQVPGSIVTEPVGINSAGEVVGYYEFTAGVPQAFIRSADGQITTFAAPTDASPTNKIAQPAAINDAGEIVGNYPDVPQGSRVFVRSTGAMTTFSVSDGAAYSTVATGINASGAIVFYGSSQVTPDAPASGAFLRSADGMITTFSAPGMLMPSSLGINASGTILGNYTIPATPTDSHGFVRSEEGVVNSFDPPRSSSTTATSINDLGVITGYYTDESSKVVSGFLRPPRETAIY
jgi:hypothetical protein